MSPKPAAEAPPEGGRGKGAAGSAAAPVRSMTSVALVVALAHGINDAYVSFLPPLLPRIMESMGLSIARAATLAMLLSIAASLVQPAVGYFADRYGRRAFVAVGPLLTGLFLSLIGFAPDYGTLLLLLLAGGMGSALFHPPAATMAARASEGAGSGLRLSIFSFGGTLGFAAGPLVAVFLAGALGLRGLWIAVVPAVAISGVLLFVLPRGSADRPSRPPPSPFLIVRHLRGPLGLVFGISALGAFVQRLFVTLEPIIVAGEGGSEALGALILSVYLGAHAAGTLAGGFLADRVDRTRLLAVLCAAAVPAHLVALRLPVGSGPALAAAAVAGFLAMAILPPVVVIAQEAVPTGAAATSGIAMGLAWATGSTGVIAAGALADTVGARTAALLCVPVLLGGSILALHPGLRRHRRPVVDGGEPSGHGVR